MKKKLLMLFLIVAALMLMLVLTSCEQLLKILNGETGTGDDEPPTIVGLETIKAEPGYLESKEYLYNSRGTNPMALTRSEKYYLVIHYKNKSNYPINTVKVTWVDSNKPQPTSKTYKEESFAEGSDGSTTYILFTTEEDVKSGTIEYTVNSVMYNAGSSTPKMEWENKDVSRSITVATRPTFTLKLNYMNEDKRKGHETINLEEEKKNVYYNSDTNTYLSDADYTGESVNLPTKSGGWVFAGWYTEPLGKGLLISGSKDERFMFWSDTTLYAYYERMYDIELENIDEITHTYKERGSDKQITFTTGAVLKNSGKNSQDSVRSNYRLDIPDTVFIDEYDIDETVREDGMPKYNINQTGREYPVVRIDAGAFTDFNTIKDVTMGKYVREIGYAAFRNCTAIETFVFDADSRLKYIGDFAFEKTESLGSQYAFTLPASVEYLGMCAFRDSTWSKNKTDGTAAGSTTLYVPATWKYIGYKCFFHTRFERVVFRPGCHFESQISYDEGENDESATGSKTIRYGQNRIGASIFGRCYWLKNVTFETDPGKNNGLNIIPERCFDAGSWYKISDKRDGDFACIRNVSFAEGLKFIGKEAFNYQVKIPELCLPKTLEEVGQRAFYNCESVINLNFEHVDRETLDREGVNKALTNDSQLRILRRSAFANLRNIDVVYITSEHFALYGDGVFQGCPRLKCIIFNNILDEDHIPTGFKSSEAGIDTESGAKYTVAKGYSPEEIDDAEVMTGHEMSDLLFGSAESGEKESGEDEFSITYSSPVRVFCDTEFMNPLKNDMLIGKRVYANRKKLTMSSGTKAYNSQVFVHPLQNLFDYTYTLSNGDEVTVKVAVQEIYKASGGQPTTTVVGYSLVYWGTRSEEIILPTQTDLNLTRGNIIEIAAYALPTSVRTVYIPSCYTRFEHDAFNGCTVLSELDFEDVNTLVYVGQQAFVGTAIRSFVGGSSLKVIGPKAFNRCESLVWVDLSASPMKNTYYGRVTSYYQYKYEYELEDYDDDFQDCLGNGVFQACTALQWVALPENIQQIRSATFGNCPSLTTLIIPTASPSTSTSPTDDDCFYEYAEPATIFTYLPAIHFYVASSATDIHQTLLDPVYIAGGRYNLIDAAPAHP